MFKHIKQAAAATLAVVIIGCGGNTDDKEIKPIKVYSPASYIRNHNERIALRLNIEANKAAMRKYRESVEVVRYDLTLSQAERATVFRNAERVYQATKSAAQDRYNRTLKAIHK